MSLIETMPSASCVETRGGTDDVLLANDRTKMEIIEPSRERVSISHEVYSTSNVQVRAATVGRSESDAMDTSSATSNFSSEDVKADSPIGTATNTPQRSSPDRKRKSAVDCLADFSSLFDICLRCTAPFDYRKAQNPPKKAKKEEAVKSASFEQIPRKSLLSDTSRPARNLSSLVTVPAEVCDNSDYSDSESDESTTPKNASAIDSPMTVLQKEFHGKAVIS